MNTRDSRELLELTRLWSELQAHAPLRPIRTDADFVEVQEFANTLADCVGDDRAHPLYSLFVLAMDMIERWEEVHVVVPVAPPREVLRHLLDSNGLKQKDLADIASQTLISDILAGRREISKRLAKALAVRFHVEIGAFI